MTRKFDLLDISSAGLGLLIVCYAINWSERVPFSDALRACGNAGGMKLERGFSLLYGGTYDCNDGAGNRLWRKPAAD